MGYLEEPLSGRLTKIGVIQVKNTQKFYKIGPGDKIEWQEEEEEEMDKQRLTIMFRNKITFSLLWWKEILTNLKSSPSPSGFETLEIKDAKWPS